MVQPHDVAGLPSVNCALPAFEITKVPATCCTIAVLPKLYTILSNTIFGVPVSSAWHTLQLTPINIAILNKRFIDKLLILN